MAVTVLQSGGCRAQKHTPHKRPNMGRTILRASVVRALRARVGAYAIRPYSLPVGESRPDSLKRYGRNLFRAKDRLLHTFVNLFSARCSVLQRLTVPSLDGFFFELKGRTSFFESSFFMLKLRTLFFNRTFFGRKPITPIF